jgi:hypothetical protein
VYLVWSFWEESGRHKILNSVVASIPWIYSALNFIFSSMFIYYCCYHEHLRVPHDLFPSGLPTKFLCAFPFPPHECQVSLHVVDLGVAARISKQMFETQGMKVENGFS